MIKTERDGDCTVISFEVDSINASNMAEFMRRIRPLIQPGAKLFFDLECLKRLDISGLGAFLSILKDLKELGGGMIAYNQGSSVKTLFDMVDAGQVIPIFSSRTEAKQNLLGSAPL
ncbi:MAG: STAS domain-containing protein [Treponema sp.]|nr:STAS domain-containing protein [Treponema sp.]